MSLADVDNVSDEVPESLDEEVTPAAVGPVHRLLFSPTSSWPIAIARILLGLTLLGWSISMMFDVDPLLVSDGLAAPEFTSESWSLFSLESAGAVRIALWVLVVASVFITIGLRPSPFLILSFLLLVSVHRRHPAILNSGDVIMRNMLFLLALAPSSAAFSVDRWIAHGRSSLSTAPLIAPVGIRLMQLQLMLAYFIAFWSKSGELWTEGTAVSTALRLEDLRRFTPPELFTHNIPLTAMLTWGTLALELALALFLWNRKARPWLIFFGVMLHLFIDAFMMVGFFGPTMFAGLFTFLNGDAIQNRVDRFRGR